VKALRLLDKQRAFHALVAERRAWFSTEFRLVKKPTIRDAHMREQLGRKQRAACRARKQKCVEQLDDKVADSVPDICSHYFISIYVQTNVLLVLEIN
jgi:hypothetical protein